MANNAKGKQKWQNFGDVKFAVVKLNSEDKDVFLKWLKSNATDFSTGVLRVLQDGWKVSMKEDAPNQCYVVTLTQGNERNINHNVAVSSRSDDMEEAFWISVYKIYVIWQDQPIPTQVNQDQSWG